MSHELKILYFRSVQFIILNALLYEIITKLFENTDFYYSLFCNPLCNNFEMFAGLKSNET